MNELDPELEEPDWDAGLTAAFRSPTEDTRTLLPRLPASLGSTMLRLRSFPTATKESRWTPSAEIDERGGRAGRFELLGEIARGGVGIILHAFDPDLGRDVAMKVLREEFLKHPGIVQRFVEEAQIGGQLQHPGILPVHEIGLDARQRPYFTMKLVEGRTLAAFLDARKNPSDDLHRWLAVFASVCRTMAYAHARGVVHRDLKPQNVMVGTFGEVHVMDWGLAKVLDGGTTEPNPARHVVTIRSEGSGASLAGSILGTPAYMAPEQARGIIDAIDERCDVFSLGAILLEILTGRPPYGGENALDRARNADLEEAFERLSHDAIDPALRELVERCLAPERDLRLRDASAVDAILSHYLASVEERARAAEIAQHRSESLLRAERKTRRVTLALAATAILLLASVFTFLHLRSLADQETRHAIERRLQEAWQAASVDDLETSLARVTEARALHAASALDEDLGSEIEVTLAHVKALQRDRTLRDTLFRIRAHPLGDPHAIGLYEEAFADLLGEERPFDVDATRARIGARALTIEPTLARCLEDWARRVQEHPPGARRVRAFLELADRLDDDPTRTAVRLAWRESEEATLRELRQRIEERDRFEVDGDTVTLLAVASTALGETDAARAFLEHAFEAQHTNDLWLNWNLAALLRTTGEPERALRHERLLRKLSPIEGWDPSSPPGLDGSRGDPLGPAHRPLEFFGRRRGGEWRRWVEELEDLPDDAPRRSVLEGRLRRVLRDMGDHPHPDRRLIQEALRR